MLRLHTEEAITKKEREIADALNSTQESLLDVTYLYDGSEISVETEKGSLAYSLFSKANISEYSLNFEEMVKNIKRITESLDGKVLFEK